MNNDQPLEHQTIAYGETISDGNYGNRKYYVEVRTSGTSFQEVVESISQEIRKREAMHEKFETLSKQIQNALWRLDELRKQVDSAHFYFKQLENREGDEKTTEESWSTRAFEGDVKTVDSKFEDLKRVLEIPAWSTSEDDIPF